jgi:hypothetical protein
VKLKEVGRFLLRRFVAVKLNRLDGTAHLEITEAVAIKAGYGV